MDFTAYSRYDAGGSLLCADIRFIMRRYLRYLSSIENFAGCGGFTCPPHRGHCSSFSVYNPHFSHFFSSQTNGDYLLPFECDGALVLGPLRLGLLYDAVEGELRFLIVLGGDLDAVLWGAECVEVYRGLGLLT